MVLTMRPNVRLVGGGVHALAALPDGRLASGGEDSIRLWDPVCGAETARLKGWGRALAVLPDGRLASGGTDGIRLWDPARGAEVARLEVEQAVACLAALPDGRLVAGDALGLLHWLVIVE